MQASVIIPVYNDTDRLKLCLDAISLQTYPRDQLEVIVVDNGSKEPPKALVESYSFCQFTEESQPGSYAARNHGLRVAQGKFLVFTDSDCLPDPHWLDAGIKQLESDPDIALVAGSIALFAKDESKPTAAELYDIAFGLPQEATVKKTGRVMTANLFTRRTIIDLVGEFDSSLMSYGDHEWSGRVADLGKKVVYNEEAIIRHPARYSVASLVKQARRHIGGKLDRKDKKRRKSGVQRLIYLTNRWIFPNFEKIFMARKELRSKGFGFFSWLKTTGVILWLQYSVLLEFVRKKLLGAKSERQ